MITFYEDREGLPMEFQEDLSAAVNGIEKNMREKIGEGSSFLGWLDYPKKALGELEQVKTLGKKARALGDVMAIVGIGGSYLGIRALYEALPGGGDRELVFFGHDLSGEMYREKLKSLEGRDVVLGVISKSGTTLEPKVAFLLLKEYMEKRYGEDAKERIFLITDERRGELRPLAKNPGYGALVIPEDVGGRYSVFTPVGTFPLFFAGFDVEQLLLGGLYAMEDCNKAGSRSMAARYGMNRFYYYGRGKAIEVFASFDPTLHALGQWYAQLFGESEGKEGKGLFPTTLTYTADLHSMGQWMQEGPRNVLETFVTVTPYPRTCLPKESEFSGISLEELNDAALQGTMEAHRSGKVPVLEWHLEKKDEYHLGAFIYYLERACAISGYLLGVNPFNQPGVEEYKKRMRILIEEKRKIR